VARALNVCHVVRTTPFHSKGGMQDVAWSLARGQAERGHRVVLLTSRLGGGEEVSVRDGVEVHFLPGTAPERYSPAFFRAVAERFARLDRMQPFDLVHSQSYAADALAGRRRAAVGRRWPAVVAHLHGVWLSETELEPAVLRTLGVAAKLAALARWPRLRAEMRRLHRFAERADAIVVDSDFSAAELVRVRPTLGGRPIRVVPAGIDCDRLCPVDREVAKRRLGLQGRVLLCLGRVTAAKGVHVAVQAFERLALPDVQLLIAGEGHDKPRIRAYVAGRGVRRLSFVDVPEDMKPLYLSAADLLVYPELTKPAFGLVAAEALACATPVVASRTGAVPEVVGDCGLLVEPGDADALAGAITGALADPARLGALGRRGRERVIARFSRRRALDGVEAVYGELLGE
jgi:glycosyltransferase involved in cell wall biosynthesis